MTKKDKVGVGDFNLEKMSCGFSSFEMSLSCINDRNFSINWLTKKNV